MSEWREGWDYRPLGSGRVLAHAIGPQYVCTGVPLADSHFLQPDTPTMEKVYSDAKKIAAVPSLLSRVDELERTNEALHRELDDMTERCRTAEQRVRSALSAGQRE